MDDLNCCICGSNNVKRLHSGLLKCSNCSFVWADISLSSSELNKIYGKDYFFGDEYFDYFAEANILKFGFMFFERKLKKLFPNSDQKPKLLEIGSAYGFFLDVSNKDFQVTGVEISQEAIEYSKGKGYNVFHGELSDFHVEEKFDIIVSFATLEHIQSPDRIIQRIHDLLIPNGYCYLTTINIGSLLARIRGKKWRMIHPPTHVSYFSSSTLRLLMERNGFQVIQCNSIWQFRSLNALFQTKYKDHLIYKIVNRLGLTKIPVPFNFGDIIGILVKKAGDL